MFILAKDQKVVMGPMQYNLGMFSHALNELEVEFELPLTNDKFIQIAPGLALYPVEISQANLNPKIEQPAGPYYTFNAESATAAFNAVPKPMYMIASELKAIAAAERYKKENAGTTVTLQGQSLPISTSRDSRSNFLVNANEGDNWKFGSTWLVLSAEDISAVLATMKSFVRTAFDWEASVCQKIDECTTPAELDAVVIVAEPEFGMDHLPV